jgi:hypothetical protein
MMFALLPSLAMLVIDFFKSPRRLEAENLFLRHQLSIALRRAPPRVCTENLIRIDCVTESPNVSGDDRAALFLPGPARLALQAEEPT